MLPKYFHRYERWREEYLSTEAGRQQWAKYTDDPDFTLTMIVDPAEGQGAEVGGYRWNEAGRLIAATIVLGSKIDSGYPDSIKYPITCSLAPSHLLRGVGGDVLAATKLAHEFGHINWTASMDGTAYRAQNELIHSYNTIFCANGYDTSDARLVKLAHEMNGTPVSIKIDRELWAEANTILYLREVFGRHQIRGAHGRAIEMAIEAYEREHPEKLKLLGLETSNLDR